MEEGTRHRMDRRCCRPADFFEHRLDLQVPFPLMQEKGFHCLNLHSIFLHDAAAEHFIRKPRR